MQITTQRTSNDNGRGQVIATARVDGKRRQRTVSWDHSVSADRNHGAAAGVLALALGLEWSDTITHDSNDSGGRHTFSW